MLEAMGAVMYGYPTSLNHKHDVSLKFASNARAYPSGAATCAIICRYSPWFHCKHDSNL